MTDWSGLSASTDPAESRGAALRAEAADAVRVIDNYVANHLPASNGVMLLQAVCGHGHTSREMAKIVHPEKDPSRGAPLVEEVIRCALSVGLVKMREQGLI